MRNLKCLFASAVLLWGAMGTANAQDLGKEKSYKSYPHMFVGLHGGAQTTFTNYKMGDLITPSYGVSFGSFFTPVVGARLHVSGFENKGGVKGINETYEYKYITSSADLMLNLTNIFSKRDDHIFNVILLGGVGLNYAWDNDELTAMSAAGKVAFPLAWTDNRLSHNVRAGLLFDLNLAKHFGMNVELTANNLADRYNSKTSTKNDWSMTASVGLIFKFGFKNKEKVEEPIVVPVEEWATRVDTTWYDDITYKEVPAQVKMEENIYYKIRMSEPDPMAKIEKITAFVKKNKNCKITVTAYSDKGTGTAKINMRYSKERAEKVVQALVDAGIDKNMITSSYKGDTVQPFAENDKNRVAIVVVVGEEMKQEKVVTKKFRTKEVRYRVK